LVFYGSVSGKGYFLGSDWLTDAIRTVPLAPRLATRVSRLRRRIQGGKSSSTHGVTSMTSNRIRAIAYPENPSHR